MPINNYQVPGVYVTQSGTALTSTNATALNIAIIADQVTPGINTDVFTNVIAASGLTIGQLTVPMVNLTNTGTGSAGYYTAGSGFTLTWASGTTTATGSYGVNYTLSTPNGGPWTYISTSGTTAGIGLPSGTLQITYGHNWGAYGTYANYNQVANTVGTPVSGTTIINPASLAAYFAFLNGADTVSILPVARVSSSGTAAATVADWNRAFATSTATDTTYLTSLVGIDVIVPLYGFINTASGNSYGNILAYGAGTVASGINAYLNSQQSLGILQRAFVGVDGTYQHIGVTSSLQALAAGFNSQRVSLVYPPVVNFNPGINASTGLVNTNFNIPGYYAAAAVAGVFVGQTNVATPITNKTVQGLNAIPNQVSEADAATNLLPYGITTIRQKRDGNFWILHGLTTAASSNQSWLYQEISISAISDALIRQIRTDLVNSALVGGPLTAVTTGATAGVVQASLTNALSNGLIQSYSNLSVTVNPSAPTTVSITFQYAPTYPINYIQATLSLNTQTGSVIAQNILSNLVVY